MTLSFRNPEAYVSVERFDSNTNSESVIVLEWRESSEISSLPLHQVRLLASIPDTDTSHRLLVSLPQTPFTLLLSASCAEFAFSRDVFALELTETSRTAFQGCSLEVSDSHRAMGVWRSELRESGFPYAVSRVRSMGVYAELFPVV